MNRRTRRVGGQSAIEFLIVSPLILVLMMGGLQFALLYRAKLTLNLATFEAARRGAVSNATWASMDRALTMSMGALYAPGSDDDTRIARGIDDDLLDRGAFLASARENVPWWGMPADANDSPVCIERLNPPDDAFAAFGYPGGTPGGPRELPNDNLAFRTRSVALSSGSQLSIQDLNLLHIRVSYCHPMIVPLAGRLISSLFRFGGGNANDEVGVDELTDMLAVEEGRGQPLRTLSTFETQCLQGDLTGDVPWGFPMVSESVVRMQSNPQQDPDFAGGGCSARVD